MQCPPLNRITVGHYQGDNINRMIHLSDVFSALFIGIMGQAISDYNKRLIILSVILLSGWPCTIKKKLILFFSFYVKTIKRIQWFSKHQKMNELWRKLYHNIKLQTTLLDCFQWGKSYNEKCEIYKMSMFTYFLLEFGLIPFTLNKKKSVFFRLKISEEKNILSLLILRRHINDTTFSLSRQ